MVWLLSLFYLLSLFSAAKCDESVELLALHDSTLAVQVEAEYLKNVSDSVLMAESWVRNYVLAHYPATNISTIIVGHNVLCNKDEQQKWVLVLPSIKNIHYSLTRWGLQNHIKVAASFSSQCLDSNTEAYKVDVATGYIKPLLRILQEMGSPYVVNPTSFDKTSNLLKSHYKSMENLGVFELNMIVSSPRKKPSKRKLSFIDISNGVLPFPPKPTPAFSVGSPLPPLVGTISPPPNSLPLAPSTSPPVIPNMGPMSYHPASPPHLPPCEPSYHGGGSVGAPVVARGHHGLWCVAKPSVPAETLQEALDYACGEGNADCAAINHDGSCHFPDTVVAHASYAFNSYWQRTKRNGGTCGFGGTAMLINSDPSYGHCRFTLT